MPAVCPRSTSSGWPLSASKAWMPLSRSARPTSTRRPSVLNATTDHAPSGRSALLHAQRVNGHVAVFGPHAQRRAVAAEREPAHVGSLNLPDGLFAPRRRVPKTERMIAQRGRQPAAIGAEGKHADVPRGQRYSLGPPLPGPRRRVRSPCSAARCLPSGAKDRTPASASQAATWAPLNSQATILPS